ATTTLWPRSAYSSSKLAVCLPQKALMCDGHHIRRAILGLVKMAAQPGAKQGSGAKRGLFMSNGPKAIGAAGAVAAVALHSHEGGDVFRTSERVLVAGKDTLRGDGEIIARTSPRHGLDFEPPQRGTIVETMAIIPHERMDSETRAVSALFAPA